MESHVQIAVIGGGPAGLSAAINAVARGKSVRVLTGENLALAKAEWVENYIGLPHISGKAMLEQFEAHAKSLGVVVERGRVANVYPTGEQFMLNFNGDILTADAVIVAIGVAAAKEVPGEAAFLGRGVSYCATCDGMLYRGKRVVVWGLAPDAPEEANFLHRIGVNVTFIKRGSRPDGLDESIPFISDTLRGVHGNMRVNEAELSASRLPVDGIFILRSAIAPSTLVAGLESDGGYIRVNRGMETNIPGLFAAGDCTGAPLQIAKAAGEGLIAALQAAKYIDNSGAKK